ncbi:MAG TPA: DUF2336 domain-containing protein [Stellaceae bacterium]|nr:DUF2336 domain-containing protein [Stellaceae bacterium]
MYVHTVEQLHTLARDRTPVGRRVLTLALGDLFLEENMYPGDRRRLVDEALRQLMHEIETPVREGLARRLASVPTAPREVVATLANDVIEVAAPLLSESRALDDSQLLAIIRGGTRDHHRAIASRSPLAEEVSDALAATNDQSVIAKLLGNDKARISIGTIAALVEQSRHIGTYHQALLNRPELTPQLAARLYPWVAAPLKADILAAFAIDPLTLIELPDSEGIDADAADQPEPLSTDRALLPPLMVQALRDSQIPSFEVLFCGYIGVPRAIVRRMLLEPRGDGLCIACKAAGIDRATLASIYLLSRRALAAGLPAPARCDMGGVLTLYDRLDAAIAATLLKKWQGIDAMDPLGSA